MGSRFAMSSSTCCKMKALMILAMLAVSEGRRLHKMSSHSDRLKSHKASSSRGAAGHKVSPSLDSDPGGALVHSPVDLLLKDPSFKEQLATMAGHIDEFALLMKKKAPPSLLMRATNMANEMSELSTDSKSAADSSLPEDMELMIADQDFQKLAQEFAAKMQENVKLKAASSQQTLETVSDQVAEETTHPQSQQTLRRVSEALASLMQDPEISVQAESLAAYLESVKDSPASVIVEKLGVQLDAMMASKKLKAKASAVVREMLKAESKDGSEFAVDDELVEDLKRTMDKTLEAVKATTQELLEAMGSTPEVKEALKVMGSRTDEDKTLEAKKEAPASFLEEWSGQEDDIPLFAVSPLLAVNPLLAVKPSEAATAFQAKGFPSRNHTYQPAFGHLRRQLKPSHGTRMEAMKDLELGPEGRAEVKPALVFLRWAHSSTTGYLYLQAIRSMLPSLRSALQRRALQRRGGFTETAVKDGDGHVEKSFPVQVPLLLCLSLFYLGSYYNMYNSDLGFVAAAMFVMAGGLGFLSSNLFEYLIVLACVGGHGGAGTKAVLSLFMAVSHLHKAQYQRIFGEQEDHKLRVKTE